MSTVYTPATLAERWGCSRAHIYALIETVQLATFRLGRTGRGIRIRGTCPLIPHIHRSMVRFHRGALRRFCRTARFYWLAVRGSQPLPHEQYAFRSPAARQFYHDDTTQE